MLVLNDMMFTDFHCKSKLFLQIQKNVIVLLSQMTVNDLITPPLNLIMAGLLVLRQGMIHS